MLFNCLLSQGLTDSRIYYTLSNNNVLFDLVGNMQFLDCLKVNHANEVFFVSGNVSSFRTIA